jgi:3',5'-cyclic AMP phosphodiesterase CpdA
MGSVLSLRQTEAPRPRLGLPTEQVPVTLDARGHFRIVQVADFPNLGHEDMLRRFVDEMAIVKPAAVLAMGDVAYDTSKPFLDFIESQFNRLEAMGIRVIVIPGNHERKGWVAWLSRFGTNLNHRVDVGPVTVISLDSGQGRNRFTPSQIQWFEAQLASARGRTILVQAHHPIFPAGTAQVGDGGGTGGYLAGFQKRFVKLCAEYGVTMVLAGHWHSDAVFDDHGNLRDDRPDFPGTKFVVTTCLGDATRQATRWPHRYSGYRILDFEGGKLVSYTQDLEGKGGAQPIASTPLGTFLKSEKRP